MTRSELQRAFFPATYQKAEVLARLQPGDKRVWTAMHVFIELRDETTLHIPFREASKVGSIFYFIFVLFLLILHTGLAMGWTCRRSATTAQT